jgi:TorA maturation chaperone TorD
MIANNCSENDVALRMARQVLYRFTALTLLDPRTGSWEEMHNLASDGLLAAAAELVRSEPNAVADPLALGEFPVSSLDPAPVLARLPQSSMALNERYEATFGLLASSACPPCESEYINGKYTFQRSQTLGDVSGFYRAFGLKPSRRHPERHDHVVLELEFMAFLLAKERQALESAVPSSQEHADICRQAQRRFLQEHLAWWTPTFARLLDHEDAGGFYSAAGRFLAALVASERALLDVPPPAHFAAPSAIERPEECEGCQLGA